MSPAPGASPVTTWSRRPPWRRTPPWTPSPPTWSAWPASAGTPAVRWRVLSLKNRCAGFGEPLLLQFGQCAVGGQLVDGLRHAGGQRAAFVEHDAELFGFVCARW